MTSLMMILALAMQAKTDDDATAALDKFKTDYKTKEASGRAAAVAELARTPHDKVATKLAQVLTSDEKDVRIAAAKGLSAMENRKKAVSYLIASVPPNAKEPMVLAAILESLGKLKESPAQVEIERHFKTKNTIISKAAILAAGEIASRTSVPALIELLKWLEMNAQEAPNYQGGGGNTPGVGGGGTVDQEARQRERELKPVVTKILQDITKGGGMNSWKEWEQWWRANAAKPPPGK